MTDYDRDVRWAYAHPADKPRRAPMDPEKQKQAEIRQRLEAERAERNRQDGPGETITIEVPARKMWGQRDRFGQLVPSEPRDPVYTEATLPDEISAREFQALMGVVPRAPEMPSPEDVFRQQERAAEERERSDRMGDVRRKMDEIARRKGQA